MDYKDVLELIKKLKKVLPRFKDGRINYRSSRVAPVITVFVKYKDKILLLKRSNNVRTYKGKWNSVAGYLDEIKPIRYKVLEELREEVNIKKQDIKRIKIGKIFRFTDKKIKKTWITNPVLVELKNKPKIKLDREHTEYKWIKIRDINKYDTVMHLWKSLKYALNN